MADKKTSRSAQTVHQLVERGLVGPEIIALEPAAPGGLPTTSVFGALGMRFGAAGPQFVRRAVDPGYFASYERGFPEHLFY